ncbi:hypothetical protein [Streptomyces sp. NPDC003952]
MTTASEVIETLTGYDELDIEAATGRTLEELASNGRDLQLTRALAAVLLARSNGAKYADAYKEVMAKPQRELGGLFEDEPDDVIPDEPDSAAGKGSSRSGARRRTSPRSA